MAPQRISFWMESVGWRRLVLKYCIINMQLKYWCKYIVCGLFWLLTCSPPRLSIAVNLQSSYLDQTFRCLHTWPFWNPFFQTSGAWGCRTGESLEMLLLLLALPSGQKHLLCPEHWTQFLSWSSQVLARFLIHPSRLPLVAKSAFIKFWIKHWETYTSILELNAFSNFCRDIFSLFAFPSCHSWLFSTEFGKELNKIGICS